MAEWNAEHYLNFGRERTRAAADLLARIRLQSPQTIVDLGCGPGNSTHLLRERWPDADLTGVDNSAEMLQAARKSYPEGRWVQADLASWKSEHPCDLVYSNAAFHWVPDHGALLRHLLQSVKPGGALAFQIPSRRYPQVRVLAHEVSRDPQWDDRMHAARSALTMESPAFYYDVLINEVAHVDLWETEYVHVMESADAVVDWISSTGLRPFLAALSGDEERQIFLQRLRDRVRENYERRVDGRVLHSFRRTFVIAYR